MFQRPADFPKESGLHLWVAHQYNIFKSPTSRNEPVPKHAFKPEKNGMQSNKQTCSRLFIYGGERIEVFQPRGSSNHNEGMPPKITSTNDQTAIN